MRNLLALIGLAVLGFVVIGWHQGWYTFQTETSTAGHRKFDVDLNTDKISKDVKSGEEKLQHAVSSNQQSSTTPTTNVQPLRPVQAQPASNKNGGVQVNTDGSISFTLPALVPGQSDNNQ
jgi:hypothetical protein